MRSFIDIINEALRPMTRADYQEHGETIADRTGRDMNQYLEGPHREEMTVDEAREYLDQYPNGTLHQDWFETDAFVTRDIHGNYLFFDPSKATHTSPESGIELWSWNKDIAEIKAVTEPRDPDITKGWWYHCGSEMEGMNTGRGWWEAVRNGDFSKTGKRYIA